MNKNVVFCILAMLFLLLSSCIFVDTNNLPQTIATPISHSKFPLGLEWAKTFPNRIAGMVVSEKSLTIVMELSDGLVLQTLDLKTGGRLWERKLNRGANGENYYTNIQIRDSKIFVTYAAAIYAVDENSGNILWQAGDLEPGFNEILSFSKNHILVVDVGRKILAYNIDTGKIDWTMGIDRGTVSLFFDDLSDTVYFFQRTTSKAINDEDGSVLWEQDFSQCSARAYLNQVVYCAIGDEKQSGVEAYNLLTKSVVWQVDLSNPGKFLYVSDKGLDRLIVQSDKTLASVDINSGKIDWKYTLPIGYYRPPVVLDDVVYIRNFYSGMITAYDLTGEKNLGYLELQPKDETMLMLILTDDMLVDPSDSFLVLYHMNQVFVYK
jgi:outer membrane protein assembly factor BamB